MFDIDLFHLVGIFLLWEIESVKGIRSVAHAILIVLVEGSNIENKLFIIFIGCSLT